jgi:DNA modification methylase
MPARSVQTCVTSPPYFGLRDYGHDGQIGLEPTPDEFVQALVQVFRGVRRVLRDDGTVWLNLGDSYAASISSLGRNDAGRNLTGGGGNREGSGNPGRQGSRPRTDGCKPKDLLGIPWMVAFALRADGWYLRSDIIWSKPNPMPESVTDRPTKAHEYLFLLSKGPRYFYDADAIREAHEVGNGGRQRAALRGEAALRVAAATGSAQSGTTIDSASYHEGGRNRRSVWTVATQPYAGAHFATFPPKLIEPCILAGTSPKACGVCGASWRRVVERSGQPPEPEHRNPAKRLEPGQAGNVGAGNMGFRASRLSGQEMAAWKEANPDRTVGWEPSCEHHDDTGRSVVLDPFAGSGTTGVVSGWHGREFIGCELNPEYAAMAEARIALEGRPGGRPAHHEPVKVIADQLGLL